MHVSRRTYLSPNWVRIPAQSSILLWIRVSALSRQPWVGFTLSGFGAHATTRHMRRAAITRGNSCQNKAGVVGSNVTMTGHFAVLQLPRRSCSPLDKSRRGRRPVLLPNQSWHHTKARLRFSLRVFITADRRLSAAGRQARRRGARPAAAPHLPPTSRHDGRNARTSMFPPDSPPQHAPRATSRRS
jgi:hypothetical protein